MSVIGDRNFLDGFENILKFMKKQFVLQNRTYGISEI